MRRNGIQKVQQNVARAVLQSCAAVLACAVLVLVAWVQPSYAQEAGTATINGSVTDTTGAVVSGATVTVNDNDMHQ